MIKYSWGGPAHPGRAGLTLIELVIASVLLSFVLGTVGLVQMRVRDASLASVDSERVARDCCRTLERVAEELRGVGHDLLLPDPSLRPGAGSVTYRNAMGTLCSLTLQLDPAETDNGIDDDLDGLVDERSLVLTQNVGAPNAVSIVLCDSIAKLGEGELPNGLDDNGEGLVDEPGFSVSRSGALLTIHLKLEEASSTGGIVSAALQTSIELRD